MRSNRYLNVFALRVAALVACAAAAASPALAQQENVFRPARGFQPAGSYAVSQLDSVNNVTGGVTVRIPLAKVAGRNGTGLSLDLIYNSALYNLQTQQADEYRVMDYDNSMGNISLNMLNVSNGGGWRYSHRYSLDIDSRGGSVPGTRVTLIAGDGGSHQLWLRVRAAGQNDDDGFSQFDITGRDLNGTYIGPNLTYYTTDGSFIRVEVVVGTAWTAYFPNGDYVSGPIVNNNTPKDADQICDRNSNCAHITNTVDGSTGLIATTELADDFGRKVVVSYGNPSLPSGTDQIYALPYNASTGGTWRDPRNQASPLTTSVTWNTISFGPPAGTLARNAASGIMYQCQSPDGSHSDWRCLNSFSLRMVSQILLPNGLAYDFTYADGLAPAGEAGQGELRQMKLPSKTGEAARAEVHYYWSRRERLIVGSSPTPWFDANINPVSQKVLTWQEESDTGAVAASNTWTYQFGTTDGNGNFNSFDDRSIVTAPDGGVTTHLFYNRTGVGAWNTGLVYKTTAPEGTSWRCWQKNEPWIGVSATGDSKNPYLRAEYRQLPGAANAGATWFDYDKSGNLVTKREYDWLGIPSTDDPLIGNPSCTVAGTVLRKTENRSWNPPGGPSSVAKAADAPTIGLINAYWNAAANRKRDSLLETRIYAGEASTAAVSQFQYDNPDTTGNVRFEYRWDNQLQAGAPAVATTGVTLSGGNAAVTERQYTSGFGLLTKEIDPSGNVTQYTYGQVQNCPAEISNLYPTLVTSPEGQTRQYNYDCATGVVTDETVTSNRSLRTHKDYDRYGRVTSTVSGYGLASPNTHTTTTEYNDAARQVRVVTDGILGRVSHFNQLGELYLDRENADDSTSPIVAGSTHDIRTVSVQRTVALTPSYALTSNPFLSDGSTSEPTLGWTLRRFDTAGRTTDIYYYRGSAKPAPFGNNSNTPTHESYSYSGATTTFNDAQSRTRTTAVDALGRLQSASEGGLTSATYGYDALDNLTSVTMTDTANYGSPKTQTRTFVYSSLGHLVSAWNPESGTTTYTYSANGALHTKTDARSVTITYTVDGLNRVKKKDYSATTPVTPAARYCYDGDKYDSSTDSCVADASRAADYAQSALTHAVARNGSTIVSETLYTGIDAQGRVTSSIQKTPGLADMPFVHQYGATGQLTAVQYPSGRWVSYDINGANRVKAVRNGQTGTNYYVQQATYKPDGSFSGATVGLDALNQWTETREYNSRLQPCKMQVQKGTQTPLLALQWKHSASDPDGACEGTGTDNNGNVLAERLQYPSGGVQQTVPRNYGYDGANRLTSYSEPTTGKTQGYGYDAFGNLWQSGAASGVPELRPNGPSWYLMGDATVKNRLANTDYDAAGYQRQLSLAYSGTNATYDAEGRLAQVTFGGVVATYDYDAEGRRVKRTDAGGAATYYVYDADGQLMAEYGGTASGAGTQYIATDHLGSTRMVQDAQGNCAVRMDYAPYGAVVSRSGQDCSSATWWSGPMYDGALRDGASELDHMGAREYWATLGRFTGPDEPFADQDQRDPQSWNLYNYVRNNPLRFIDQTGRACVVGPDGKEYDDDSLGRQTCAEAHEADKHKKPDITVGVGRQEAALIMLASIGERLSSPYQWATVISGGVQGAGIVLAPIPTAVAQCVAAGATGGSCDKTNLAMAVIPGGPAERATVRLTRWGWTGTRKFLAAVRQLRQPGTHETLEGIVPTLEEAVELIKHAGGTINRVEKEGHAVGGLSTHTYPHINYTTSSGGKATVRIQAGGK